MSLRWLLSTLSSRKFDAGAEKPAGFLLHNGRHNASSRTDQEE